jgi:hypothetical protein
MQINTSIKSILGSEQAYNLECRASTTAVIARQRALDTVMELATTRPVITFGLTWLESYRFGLPNSYTVKMIKNNKQIAAYKKIFSTCKTGILGLPDDLEVGLDVRFQVDAVVVIFSEEVPNAEDCK